MLKYLFFIFIISFQYSLKGQDISVTLDSNDNIIINNVIFNHGELKISNLSNAIGKKYKIKRLKRPNLRLYIYQFKNEGIEFMATSWYEPIDRCMSMKIDYHKNKRKGYKGNLKILGKEINSDIIFEDIAYDNEFKHLIDPKFLEDGKFKHKARLTIKNKFYSITFSFDLESNKLKHIKIG